MRTWRHVGVVLLAIVFLAGLLWLVRLGEVFAHSGSSKQLSASSESDLQPAPVSESQVQPATVTVQPPTGSVLQGEHFTVAVKIAALATPLSAFQFDLSFDHLLLQSTGAEPGDFLISTGRSHICPKPSYPADDTIRFACATIGEAIGPTGDGNLAILNFTALDVGTSPLTISALQLPGPGVPPAQTPASLLGGEVTIISAGQSDNTLYLPVIMRQQQSITSHLGTSDSHNGANSALGYGFALILGLISPLYHMTTGSTGARPRPEHVAGRRTRGHRLVSVLVLVCLLGSTVRPWMVNAQSPPQSPSSPMINSAGQSVSPVDPSDSERTGAISSTSITSSIFNSSAANVYWAYLDVDGDVDQTDLAIAAGNWNYSLGDACYSAGYDFDGNDAIDVFDLAWVGNDFDIAPPEIQILSPGEGQVIGGANTVVTGIFSDTHDVITVTVNGIVAVLGTNSFSVTVPLEGGNQVLDLVAEDELGQMGLASRAVKVDGDGPTIEIHAPKHRQSVYSLTTAVATSYTDFMTVVNTGSLSAQLIGETGAVSDVKGDLTLSTEGAWGVIGTPLADDAVYTLTISLDDGYGNPGQASAVFYVPPDPENIEVVQEPELAGLAV